MITIEEYPDMKLDTLEDVIMYLRRISEMRYDDVSNLNKLGSEASYTQGFAKKTYSYTSSEFIARVALFNDGDASSGAITLTLDDNPIDGQTHYIAKIDSSGNAVTVSGNGNDINGSSTLALSSQYAIMKITYMANAGEWRRWI